MGGGFPDGGFAIEVVHAGSRDELIRVFAEYRVVPKKNPMASSEVSKSDYILERRGDKVGGNEHTAGLRRGNR